MELLFDKLPIDIKYLILKQLPRDFLFKYTFRKIKLIDDFFNIFCEHCYKGKKRVWENHGFRACFNLDCTFRNVANSEIYDYCELCNKPTEFHSNYKIAFYCEHCDIWWSYHEKFNNDKLEEGELAGWTERVSRCKTRATNIGWKTEGFNIIFKEWSKQYNAYDMFSNKEEFKKLCDHTIQALTWSKNYDCRELIFSFEQGDKLVFECKQCDETYELDPIGS
jgi:hypothetical protein